MLAHYLTWVPLVLIPGVLMKGPEIPDRSVLAYSD